MSGGIVILPELVARLRRSRRVAVLTGAGISAESGIPTFRDTEEGMWTRFDPSEVATPEAFERDPAHVWAWYDERRRTMLESRPNPGHHALVEMERLIPGFTLITQNIDGLHAAAGSKSLIELHGNIHVARCVDERTVFERWEDDGEIPPRCPNCGGVLRPHVVWFGEVPPFNELSAAIEAARQADVFLSVGTSAMVVPAASLPYEALQAGATLVEVNPEDTPLTPYATHVLQGPSGVVLPQLVAAVWPAESETEASS